MPRSNLDTLLWSSKQKATGAVFQVWKKMKTAVAPVSIFLLSTNSVDSCSVPNKSSLFSSVKMDHAAEVLFELEEGAV